MDIIFLDFYDIFRFFMFPNAERILNEFKRTGSMTKIIFVYFHVSVRKCKVLHSVPGCLKYHSMINKECLSLFLCQCLRVGGCVCVCVCVCVDVCVWA